MFQAKNGCVALNDKVEHGGEVLMIIELGKRRRFKRRSCCALAKGRRFHHPRSFLKIEQIMNIRVLSSQRNVKITVSTYFKSSNLIPNCWMRSSTSGHSTFMNFWRSRFNKSVREPGETSAPIPRRLIVRSSLSSS